MIRNHLLDPESSPQGDASSSSGGFANSGSNYGNATATASGSGSMQDDWYGGGVGGGPGNIAGSAAAGGGGSDGYGGIGQQGFVQPQHQHQPHQQYPQQQLPQPPQPPQQHGFGSDVGGGGGYVNMHTGMDMGGDLGGGVLGGGGGGMEGSMGGALEDEAPLLEELGIRPQTIVSKTMAVLRPRRKIDPSVMDDADLAGPLVFCLALGSCLLLAGKVHFGFVHMHAHTHTHTCTRTYSLSHPPHSHSLTPTQLHLRVLRIRMRGHAHHHQPHPPYGYGPLAHVLGVRCVFVCVCVDIYIDVCARSHDGRVLFVLPHPPDPNQHHSTHMHPPILSRRTPLRLLCTASGYSVGLLHRVKSPEQLVRNPAQCRCGSMVHLQCHAAHGRQTATHGAVLARGISYDAHVLLLCPHYHLLRLGWFQVIPGACYVWSTQACTHSPTRRYARTCGTCYAVLKRINACSFYFTCVQVRVVHTHIQCR